MVSQDLVRGLSLLDQRGNDLVFLMEFPLCHVDATTGNLKLFKVFSVGCSGIVCIFVSDCTVIDPLRASIANVRRFVQTAATFLFEVFAGLVTCRTGSTFHTAKNDLAAGIGFLAMIAMDTEVLGIIKGALVIPVRQPVSLYLF